MIPISFFQDFKTALEQYHNALAILQDRERDKTWDTARVLEARSFIYDHLANLSMAMGLLDQSEKLFKETLKGYLQVIIHNGHYMSSVYIPFSDRVALYIYCSQPHPHNVLYCVR